MYLSRKQTQVKGSVLMFSLILLSFMLISALSLAAVSVTERRASFSTEKSSRSFQVADSGVEIILQRIYSGTYDTSPLSALAVSGASCVNGEIIDSSTLSPSAYTISFYDNSGGKLMNCTDTTWRAQVVKIKSEGMSGNTTRALEVGVRP